jgi:hypothetical protein
MKYRLYKVLSRLSNILIPVLLVVFVIIYKTNSRFYIYLAREDNLLEWSTFVLLFLTGVLSLIIAIQIRKNQGPYFCFFLIFSILCILFSLEEISWYQRIFDIKSPEFFLEHSDKREINIHNVIQKWGKNLSIFGIAYDLKTKHIAGLTLFVYGTCLPIIALNRRISSFFRRKQFVIPPPILSFSFLIAALMMFDKPTGKEEEIGEFFFSICLFLFTVMEHLKLERKNVM